MRLIGWTMTALDGKGRLAIPARYRPELEESCQGRLVVTVQHHGKSLLIYPEQAFEAVAAKVSEFSDFEEAELNFKYLFFGHAHPMEMDSNGRVVVPPLLRELVGIDKRVAMLGQTNKFELWSEERWLETQKGLYTGKGVPVPDKLKSVAL